MKIADLKRLLAEATPGEWRHEGRGVIAAIVNGKNAQVACVTGQAAMYGDPSRQAHVIRDADADLIALSKSALPALLAVAEAAGELTSWDWHSLLVDHSDADTVRADVARLTEALAALEGK